MRKDNLCPQAGCFVRRAHQNARRRRVKRKLHGGGCDATWGRAHAGVPLQEIAKTNIANPVMIVDEIEKAGTLTANDGLRVSMPEALLGLLKPSPAISWECPYTRRSYDMSQISWIMTANERAGILTPLLDRCRVFNIG